MTRLLYAAAAVLLVAFMLACLAALVAAIVLALLPAIVGAAPAGCPIGWPVSECPPDVVLPPPPSFPYPKVYLAAVMR